MIAQYPLRLTSERQYIFANFIANTPVNAEAVAAIKELLSNDNDNYLYVWGSECGKSHLLMAACDAATQREQAAVYVPLNEMVGLSPEILKHLEEYELVCLDDLHAVAGEKNWDEAIFHLFNAIKQKNHTLIISANSSPATVTTGLADLASRLLWGATYALDTLDDAGKQQLLKQVAKEKGMQLADGAASYLLSRYSRAIPQLMILMEKLDNDSLAKQQKLTIPFLRQSISELSASATSSAP